MMNAPNTFSSLHSKFVIPSFGSAQDHSSFARHAVGQVEGGCFVIICRIRQIRFHLPNPRLDSVAFESHFVISRSFFELTGARVRS
jgi:hypothetical protein